MNFSRSLVCNLPSALRLTQNSSHFTCKNILKHAQRGYVAPICNNKLQNRFMSTNNNLEKVYYGLLTPQIKGVKIISFTTSLGGLVAQPILFKQVATMGGGLPVIIGLCSFLGFFTFVTPFLLHYITKRYITHLDYNPETQKYIATVLTFFCRQKKIEFTADDVKVPEIPGMFTSFQVNGKPLFVDPSLFSDPSHYGKLMGYDKPIDFKLYDDVSSKK